MKKIFYSIMALVSCLTMTSCSSGDPEFPDFDYQTVYFASNVMMRTVELGKDMEVDLTMDNQHKVRITATMGGSYGNKSDITVNIAVDPTLIEGKTFEDGTPMTLLPSTHYEMADSKIVIPAGNILGGVEVKLTDAFFNDPKSISNNYVIPVKMTQLVSGADSILSDKNFVIYAVKYVNPWHAHYLRRGTDEITSPAGTRTEERKAEYVERDETVYLKTSGYKSDILEVTLKDDNNENITVAMQLTFDEAGKCQIASATDGITVIGSGEFVENGEKKVINGQDRDALYLDYTINIADKGITCKTKDTLVLKARGIMPEYMTLK